MPSRPPGRPEVGDALAEHDPAGELGQRQADGLGDERHGARGARVGLDHVQLAAVDRVLHVEQPDDADRERDLARRRADLLEHLLAERVRRQHAGAVAGVHAGLLDVLHDAADPDLVAVAERVDVDLGRVLEEAVEVDLAAPHPPRASQVVREPVGASRRSPSRGRRARRTGARAAG